MWSIEHCGSLVSYFFEQFKQSNQIFIYLSTVREKYFCRIFCFKSLHNLVIIVLDLLVTLQPCTRVENKLCLQSLKRSLGWNVVAKRQLKLQRFKLSTFKFGNKLTSNFYPEGVMCLETTTMGSVFVRRFKYFVDPVYIHFKERLTRLHFVWDWIETCYLYWTKQKQYRIMIHCKEGFNFLFG